MPPVAKADTGEAGANHGGGDGGGAGLSGGQSVGKVVAAELEDVPGGG